MVAVSDFSGLASSIWALARAPAIAPMVSLERCMIGFHLHEVETHRTRFGALGPHTMPDRLGQTEERLGSRRRRVHRREWRGPRRAAPKAGRRKISEMK